LTRQNYKCRCCGCAIADILRCEQRTQFLFNPSDFWNATTAPLPVLCDAIPRAMAVESSREWVKQGDGLSGGASSLLQIDARMLQVPLRLALSKFPPSQPPSGPQLNNQLTATLFAREAAATLSILYQLVGVDKVGGNPGCGNSLSEESRGQIISFLESPLVDLPLSPLGPRHSLVLTPSGYELAVSFSQSLVAQALDPVQHFLLKNGDEKGLLPAGVTYPSLSYPCSDDYLDYWQQWVDSFGDTAYTEKRVLALNGVSRLVQAVASTRLVNDAPAVVTPPVLTLSAARTGEGAYSVTAACDRGSAGFGVAGGASIVHGSGRRSTATSGYTHVPIQRVNFSGTPETKIYRDGDLVATITFSSDAKWNSDCEEASRLEGSYFVEQKNLGPLSRPVTRAIEPLISFASFVVDTTQPAGAIEQVNDYFAGDVSNVYPQVTFTVIPSWLTLTFSHPFIYGVRSAANEPCQLFDSFGRQVGGSGEPNGRRTLFNSAGSLVTLSPTLGAGSYSLRPSRSLASFQNFYDRAGNEMFSTPRVVFTVHPVPQDGRYGAHASLSLPRNLDVLATAEGIGYQSPIYENPIATVSITFNKRVRGVASEMLVVAGAEAKVSTPLAAATSSLTRKAGKPRSRTNYQVVIAEQAQEPNTQWVCTFTPSADVIVIPDEITDEEYPTSDDFPTIGSDTVIYTSLDNDTEYRWNGDGYETLPVGQLPAGAVDSPERCRLSARVSWALAQSGDVGTELIDTSSSLKLIGHVASITASVTPELADNESQIPKVKAADIEATDYVVINVEGGKTHGRDDETFVPEMPGSFGEPHETPCSYWGVGTTIYPSTPRTVTECASPSVPQKHSSAIFGDDEITGLSITLEVEGDKPNSFADGGNRLDLFTGSLGAAIADLPLSLSATLDGLPTSQNVWSSHETPGAEVQVASAWRSLSSLEIPFEPAPLDPPRQFGGWFEVRVSDCEVTGIQATAVARRRLIEYAALKTATPYELLISVSVRASLTMQSTITRGYSYLDHLFEYWNWSRNPTTGLFDGILQPRRATVDESLIEVVESVRTETIHSEQVETFQIPFTLAMEQALSAGDEVVSDLSHFWNLIVPSTFAGGLHERGYASEQRRVVARISAT